MQNICLTDHTREVTGSSPVSPIHVSCEIAAMRIAGESLLWEFGSDW